MGGRSKPGSEIAEVKKKLRRLADDILAGKVNPYKGSVASQVLGTWLKACDTEIRQTEATVKLRELEEIKLREFEEIRHELREVRELYEDSKQEGKKGNPWASWTN